MLFLFPKLQIALIEFFHELLESLLSIRDLEAVEAHKIVKHVDTPLPFNVFDAFSRQNCLPEANNIGEFVATFYKFYVACRVDTI